MKSQLKRMQMEILPSEEKQNEVLENILENRKASGKVFPKTMKFATAAAVCVSLLAVFYFTGAYDKASAYVKEHFFGNYFSEEAPIVDQSDSNIFKDEDSHIKLTMEKFYTDNMATVALVHYTAKDQEGEDFLNNMVDFQDLTDSGTGLNDNEAVEWSFGDEKKSPFMGNYGMEELKSRSDKKNKYFVCYSHFEDFETIEFSTLNLYYYLTDLRRRSRTIDISGHTFEASVYKINRRGHKEYTDAQPEYLYVSQTCAAIKGSLVKEKSTDVKEIRRLYDLVKTPEKFRIVLKDGKILTAANYSHTNDTEDEKGYANVFMASLTEYEGNGEITPVDPAAVDYLEICGEKYELKKMK